MRVSKDSIPARPKRSVSAASSRDARPDDGQPDLNRKTNMKLVVLLISFSAMLFGAVHLEVTEEVWNEYRGPTDLSVRPIVTVHQWGL
jgi:hypothetical protein